MKLADLLVNLKPKEAWGDLDIEISGIAYDSRKVKPGYLFVAIPGLTVDGHDFLLQAVRGGAGALIISRPQCRPDNFFGPVVLVEDSRRALSSLADIFYAQPSRRLKLIGVTGTNGKTTTAYLITAILRAAGRKVGMIGTIEYQVGDKVFQASRTTPESLELQQLLAQMSEAGCEYAVMEVSSHSLALERVRDCYFNSAVFTNLTAEHLDFHHTMKDYFAAKRKLFEQLDAEAVAVANADNEWGQRIVAGCKARIITYSRYRKADVKARQFEATSSGVWADLQVGEDERQLRSPLMGDYNLENLLAAVSVAVGQQIEWSDITRGVSALTGVPGRFEPVDCGQDFTVVVDYAHTDDALLNLLTSARKLTKGKLISVFGCGGDRDKEKRPRMGAVAHNLSDYVVITSDNPRSEDPLKIIAEVEVGLLQAGGEADEYHVCPDRRQAIEDAIGMARAGDMVVIAGKGHEDYQIIGEERSQFDDREVARRALLKRYKRGV